MSEWYELKKVVVDPPVPGEFRMATAAVRSCDLCNTIIDGMGGPGHGSICVDCADDLRRGNLRGAVIRGEDQ